MRASRKTEPTLVLELSWLEARFLYDALQSAWQNAQEGTSFEQLLEQLRHEVNLFVTEFEHGS